MENRIVDMKLDQIEQKENSRVFYDDKETAELMVSMRQTGLLQPIGISPIEIDSNGVQRYEVVWGNRRYVAAKKLGWALIPCIIVGELTSEEMFVKNAIENLQRVDPSLGEQGRIFAKLLKQGLTATEIAARVGISVNKVRMALEIFNRVPKKYRDKIVHQKGNLKEGKISSTAAFGAIQAISKAKLSAQEQEQLFEYAAQDGVSNEIMRTASQLVETGIPVTEATKKATKYRSVYVSFLVDKEKSLQLEQATGRTLSSLVLEELGKSSIIPMVPIDEQRLRRRKVIVRKPKKANEDVSSAVEQ